jgi:hypothetical protein
LKDFSLDARLLNETHLMKGKKAKVKMASAMEAIFLFT